MSFDEMVNEAIRETLDEYGASLTVASASSVLPATCSRHSRSLPDMAGLHIFSVLLLSVG